MIRRMIRRMDTSESIGITIKDEMMASKDLLFSKIRLQLMHSTRNSVKVSQRFCSLTK